jgi:ABC-2 type transport system ATP-binding protein
MSPPRSTIAARDLTKRYRATTAVDGLTLDVSRGEIYGFLGPNGAGKTTTMRLLTGLLAPTRGDGYVDGVHCTNRQELVDRVGLLPETPPLYEELTGREQLQFAAELRSIDWNRIASRALDLAGDLELESDLDRRIATYSSGTKRKLAFVQAVQHDPAVAFLDEPTAGLDPRAAKSIRELILDLADRNTAVFLSTHILPIVEAIADRVGVLQDGRLIASDAPENLTDRVGRADGDADLEDVFVELTNDLATAWDR